MFSVLENFCKPFLKKVFRFGKFLFLRNRCKGILFIPSLQQFLKKIIALFEEITSFFKSRFVTLVVSEECFLCLSRLLSSDYRVALKLSL